MPISNVSIKGQITLPVRMRRKLGIKALDRVLIEETNNAIVIRKAVDVFQFKGFLGKALPADEERRLMQKAVADHVKGVEQ